jgi:hypothetical protein
MPFTVGSGKPETTITLLPLNQPKNADNINTGNSNDTDGSRSPDNDNMGSQLGKSRGRTREVSGNPDRKKDGLRSAPPASPNQKIQGLDLDKLYRAVSVAESGIDGTPWHKAANNPVSILTWDSRGRHLKQFSSIAENKAAFKSLWVRVYGNRLPNISLAKKYTGDENAVAWLATVQKILLLK